MVLKKKLGVVALGVGLTIPATVFATNGMFMIGYGAKGTGMGGAGVAYPQDAMAAAYNPALMTEVDGPRFDATIELFRPPRAVTHDSSGATFGDTDARSKWDLFPIPALGAVFSDRGGMIALGVAVVGAGLGTNYPQPEGTFFSPPQLSPEEEPHRKVGVMLMQMQILPSFAYRISDQHSVGASVVLAAQTFKAWGLEAFGPPLNYTNDPERLTDNGYDWGFGVGVRLGWQSSFMEDNRLRLGVNYAPRVSMQKFNRYSGLFANQGEFDIPENFTVGLAYKFTPKSTVAFDIQRIFWSEIESIGNPGPLADNPPKFYPFCDATTDPEEVLDQCRAGGGKGLGFGWKNQTVYKLGVDYRFTPGMIFRAGFNYGKAPIPEDQVLFNMLAPATTEEHYTLGMTLMIGKDSDLTLSLMHSPENTIKGPTAFSPEGGTIVQGSNASLSMEQTSLGIAYGARF